MTIDPDQDLAKSINDLIQRKLEIENRILSAYKMGMGTHIINQLIDMKEEITRDLEYYTGIKSHHEESKDDDDTNGLIV